MKVLSVRKYIRLKGYDYSKAGYYFITICVKNRENILGEVVGDDAHIVPFVRLSEYGRIVRKHILNISCSYSDVYVDKYIVMPNHIHMILILQNNSGTMWASSPTTARIPSIIRSLKTLVTKECEFSLWQRSYHDHIIRDEAEYQRILKYIDENPKRWFEDVYFMK